MALLMPALEVFRRISFSLPIAVAGTTGAVACVGCGVAGFLVCAACLVAFTCRGRDVPSGLLALVSVLGWAVGVVDMLAPVLGELPNAAGILGGAGYLAAGVCLCALVMGWIKAPSCGASYCLGALFYELLGNAAMYLQIVFTTLYILGLDLISTRQASLNDDSRLGERCLSAAVCGSLSQRETEILQLLVTGYSVARIAEKLTLSPETVRTHKKRIYAKLDVHSHDELVRLARSGRQDRPALWRLPGQPAFMYDSSTRRAPLWGPALLKTEIGGTPTA